MPDKSIEKEESIVSGTSLSDAENQQTQRLHSTKARFATLVESLPFDVFLVGGDGRYVLQNTSSRDCWGDIIGKRPEDVCKDKKTLALWQSNNQRAFRGEVVEEDVSFTVKGEERHFHNIISPVREGKEISGILGINIDITQQYRVECRFRSLVEHTSDGVFCYAYDPPIATSLPIAEQVKRLYAGILVECNDVCAQSYGARTASEVIGRPLLELFRTEPGSLDDLFEKMIRNGYRTADEEGVQVQADGTKRYYLNNGHGVVENGQLVHVWGTFRDITARKKAERALKAEKGFVETALDAQTDTFFVFDPKTGKAIRWNRSFNEVSEYSDDEIRSMRAPDSYYSRDDLEKAAAAIENLGGAETVTVELSMITKSGKTIPTEYVGSALRDGKGDIRYLIAIGRDIAERKEAEERARRHQAELVHMARLSTIGQMASELAHELNQPLCATLAHLEGCLGIVRSGRSNTDKLIQKLEKAIRQIDRASHIVARVKGFAKTGRGKRSAVFINQVAQEAVDFMATELRHNQVAVGFSLNETLPPVQADPIQIEQVFLNLIHNAIDAMADTPKKQRKLMLSTSAVSGSVDVAIKDTGRGVDPADAERIFESFATTKPSGLGVGLSISRSIVEAHGGRVYLGDNSANGATFCFTLPLKAK